MHVLNYTLAEADGRYLSSQELLPIEQYIETFDHRLLAYQALREGTEPLVTETLSGLSKIYPDLVKQHGPRCQSGMSDVLRYIALSMLRDDEEFFKEQIMTWLDTILVAMRHNRQCAKAYRLLQVTIAQHLSEKSIALVSPYLDLVIQTLESHA